MSAVLTVLTTCVCICIMTWRDLWLQYLSIQEVKYTAEFSSKDNISSSRTKYQGNTKQVCEQHN